MAVTDFQGVRSRTHALGDGGVGANHDVKVGQVESTGGGRIKGQKLERWISDRVLKLTCTAEDMEPLAQACGLKKAVHKWKPAERVQLMAELDAAYFLLYGIERDDVEYILSTFTGTRRRDEAETGRYTTAELILSFYDEMAEGKA